LREEIRKAAAADGVTHNYDDIIRGDPVMACGDAIDAIERNKSWMQFDALVLDIRYTDFAKEKPLAGFTDVWDPLVEEFRNKNKAFLHRPDQKWGPPLPWRGVYISTVYWGQNDDMKAVADAAKARGIPPDHIFEAGPLPQPYARAAQKIISDMKRPSNLEK
jgi:hypothetical protein